VIEEQKVSAKLTQGPIGRILLRLTGPMVWGMLAMISLNLVDTFFIAQLGKEELAAMSFSLPIVMVLMSFALGISVGAGSLISRAIGSADTDRVKKLSTSSLILTFSVMSVLAAIGIVTVDLLFGLFNAPPTVLPYIHEYMVIWYFGLPAMGLAMIGNTVITSSGDVRLPAIIMFFVALLNLVLDPIFIFGYLGFPKLQISGAALATTVSYIAAFLISFWGVMIKKKMLDWHIRLKEMLVSWKEILDLALPACASQLIVPVTSAITVWMLSHYGPGVVAGYGIVSRLEAFALIVVFGLSSSLAPFVGQNWGARDYDRVNRAVILGHKFALVWGAAVAIFLALGSTFIPHMFIDDPAVIATVSLYLLSVPFSYGAAGSLFVTNSFLNAVGKSKSVVAITLIRYFVLYLPLALSAMKYYGPQGIFFVIAFVNLVMGIGAYFWGRNLVATQPVYAEVNPNIS
jgi:putative MATE family efflux protein